MTMRDNERDALVRVSGDLQEYANGCNAIYLKELAARIEALAAPAEGGEVVIVDCPACMGRGYQGTGIDEAPTTTCRACDGTGAVDEDGLIDSAGGAKDDFCTTEGHVTGGTDSCINCGTTAVAAVVPDAPLKVFDSGPWIYEPAGVRFSGQQLAGEIGRASCWDRGGRDGSISGGAE